MPKLLPLLLALILGVGAAALVACGDSSTANGIPAADADDLSSQLEDIAQAVESKRCSDISGQLGQVDRRIDALPASVDDRLVERLRQASDRLAGVALPECNEAKSTQTQTQEPDTRTQTQETVTTVEPPVQTETQAPDTTTEPPPDATEPSPGGVQPPLDEDTVPQEGGGVQPEVTP